MRKLTLTIFSWFFLFLLISFTSASPNGASLIIGDSERATSDTASSVNATAGNITA